MSGVSHSCCTEVTVDLLSLVFRNIVGFQPILYRTWLVMSFKGKLIGREFGWASGTDSFGFPRLWLFV